MDEPTLAGWVGAEWARHLAHLDAAPWGAHDLEALMRQVKDAGGAIEQVGRSCAGEPIYMCSLGSGARRVLLWAFPHPDEPLGAISMRALVSALAAGAPDGGWRFHMVVCPDPDLVALNANWSAAETLEAFTCASARPEHLGREVDYGFPVSADVFDQPPWPNPGDACRRVGRCVDPACGDHCQRLVYPPGALPESLALVEAMRRVRPERVVSLHDTHTGGAFTFTLHRPDADLAHALRAVVAACGVSPHLGVKIDSGRPWDQGIDLIREPTLAGAERAFARRPGVEPGRRYLGAVSASMHLEAHYPGADFLVPEAPHFTHPRFADRTPLGETRVVSTERYAGRRGERIAQRGPLTLPDGSVIEVCYRVQPVDDPPAAGAVPVTVGMLGVEAVARRRWAFAHADRLWHQLAPLLVDSDHPLAAERRALRIGAGQVMDRSLLIWRVSRSATAPATHAHAADFLYRWPIHEAARVGTLITLGTLAGGAVGDAVAAEARRVIDLLLAGLPAALRRADRRGPAASQLARVLVWLAHA